MTNISLAGEWTKKGEIPFEIVECSASVFNNEIYVFGGPHGGQNWTLKYNPVTDTWTKLADMRYIRQSCSSVVVNEKIFVIGSATGIDLPIEVYDPITDTWESKSVMPNCRGISGVVAIGDEIYVLGGYRFAGDTCFADIDVYNAKTDTWTKKKPMPTTLDSFVAQEVNGKIIIISGIIGMQITPNVWEYDPVEELWTRKADIPNLRAFASIVEIAGKIYVFGGSSNMATGLSTFDVYDTLTDTWGDTQNMPLAIDYQVSGLVNNRVYIIGGIRVSQQSDTINKNTYEYNPFPQPTTSISPKESLIGTWGKIKAGS